MKIALFGLAVAVIAFMIGHDIGWYAGRANGIRWATQEVYGK